MTGNVEYDDLAFRRRRMAEMLLGQANAVAVDLSAHRSRFPALAANTYFNYGATGVMPREAMERVRWFMDRLETDGPFSYQSNIEKDRSVRGLRGSLAKLFGVEPESIALTENTTAGSNAVIWGLDWRKGDELVVSNAEHVSVLAAVGELRDRFGVKVTEFDAGSASSDEDILECVARAVSAKTRLLITSHVYWTNGYVAPLRRIAGICRTVTNGECLILADGAQSAGMMPVNFPELDVDFFATTLSKWLCGPSGVGALIGRGAPVSTLKPIMSGWRGVEVKEPEGTIGWCNGVRRWEGGSPAYALYGAAEAAVAAHDEFGKALFRWERIKSNAETLAGRLKSLPLTDAEVLAHSGLVFLSHPTINAHRLAMGLEARNILVRSIPFPERLRFCVHYLTTVEDIDRLIDGLGKELS